MKRVFLLICFFGILLSPIACAETNISLKKDKLSSPEVNLSQNLIPVPSFDNKLTAIEIRMGHLEKYCDGVIETQRHNYSVNVSVFIALTFLFIALVGIFNIAVISKDLNRQIVSATQKIRDEFARDTKKLAEGIKVDIDIKLQKIEEKYSKNFSKLEANICETLGRLYKQFTEEAKLPADAYCLVSAIWFARELDKWIKLNYSDETIRKQIVKVTEILDKSCSIEDPEFIAELQQIIDHIDINKFREEKEALRKTLKKKVSSISEGEKKISGDDK